MKAEGGPGKGGYYWIQAGGEKGRCAGWGYGVRERRLQGRKVHVLLAASLSLRLSFPIRELLITRFVLPHCPVSRRLREAWHGKGQRELCGSRVLRTWPFPSRDSSILLSASSTVAERKAA